MPRQKQEPKNGWLRKQRKDLLKGGMRDAMVYYENGIEKTFRWADINCRNLSKTKYPPPPGCKKASNTGEKPHKSEIPKATPAVAMSTTLEVHGKTPSQQNKDELKILAERLDISTWSGNKEKPTKKLRSEIAKKVKQLKKQGKA
jgi:hypothetical protein